RVGADLAEGGEAQRVQLRGGVADLALGSLALRIVQARVQLRPGLAMQRRGDQELPRHGGAGDVDGDDVVDGDWGARVDQSGNGGHAGELALRTFSARLRELDHHALGCVYHGDDIPTAADVP